MATTYSSRFYTSSGAVLPNAGMSNSNAGGLLGAIFSETIPTTVLDGLDEHYLMPVPANGVRRLQTLLMSTGGDMDTNATPLLDADLVVRTTLNGVATDTIVYNASSQGPFSVAGLAGQEVQRSGPPKIGGTAGWAVNGAANLSEATCPASQTAATLVVPIYGLKVGDTITGFKIAAQIESAGGAVTLDADLRKMTVAAADPTDASVGAITQVAVSADTAVAAAKTGLAEIVAADEWFYILITATTAASTDIRFLGATVTTTQALTELSLRVVDVWVLIPQGEGGIGHLVFKVNTAAATPNAANLTVIPLVL